MANKRKCRHTPCPGNYVEWHLWAEQMMKKYRQVRCPVCRLWAIWVPKLRAVSEASESQP